MANQYSQWFSSAMQHPYSNEQAVEIVQLYFNEAASVTNTAERLISLCLHDSPIEDIWSILLGLAIEISTADDRIPNLIKAVLQSPNKSQVRTLSDADADTSFAREWRDVHDSLWSNCAEIKSVSDPAVHPWINYNIFSALCISTNIIEPHWGLEHIVTALEKADLTSTIEISPQQEVALIVAEKYFVHCARYFLLNRPYETSWGDYSPVWKPNDGLSRDRWGFWKRRWEGVRNVQGVSYTLVEGATRALVAMVNAERDMQW